MPSFSESPTDELAELEDDLPPPTPPPPQPPVIHFEEHEKPASFKELRVECWHQLDFVCEQWKLVEFSKRSATPMISADNASTPSSSPRIPSRNSPDLAMRRSSSGARASPVPLALPSAGHLVLDLLQSTTEAVRSVQRFLLVHPDHDAALNARLSSMNPRASSMAVGTSLDQRHQSQLGISTAARPRTSMAPPSSSSLMSNRTASTSAQPVVKDDQINSVRKRCLELLGVLQHIEEKYRLESSEQAEEASLDNPDATEEASASGHLYKDVSLDDLIKEREVVKTWVQEVDELLRVSMMIGKDKNKKSSSEANSRASPDPSQFSEQLPSWARPEAFSGDQLREWRIGHRLVQTPIERVLCQGVHIRF